MGTTLNNRLRIAALFAAQLLLESAAAGLAELIGLAAGGTVTNLLRPANEDPGAGLMAAFYIIALSAPVLAGVFVDRRVRFSGGRTLDTRAGPWVAAAGGLICAAAQLVVMAIENAPAPPASAGAGAVLGYVANADSLYWVLGLYVMWPAIGMVVYGATKLVLAYLYRNHPNPPPGTRTAKPSAIESLRLGGRG